MTFSFPKILPGLPDLSLPSALTNFSRSFWAEGSENEHTELC